ncbi:MAG: hypothetical protein Q8S23_05490 [Bacteroidales bacterium]|nr:hypothetical protein [Bacteroidales bacterium]
MKRLNKIVLFITVVIFMLPMTACAQRVKFLSSAVVPAANGVVKVKKDSNKNYQIKVFINNLAEPQRLTPPREMYLVWMVTENNQPQNIGKIEATTTFMSSKLKASFQSVSSTKPTKIFLTAENDPTIQYSYSETILTTSNF